MKNRIYIKDLKEHVGEEVAITGWVDVRRDQGQMIFLDIRDMSGTVQTVMLPGLFKQEPNTHLIAKSIRPEFVVSLTGLVNERPEKNKNLNQNGDIELVVKKIEILNTAETPPFDLSSDGLEIGEEHRLKYRYIDLRRPRLQKNIKNRHRVIKFIRDFLDKENFVEIETPLLTKSTPEGARDYVVPSRLEKGKFYALPQSPQQYKQLLMVAGFEKYFQIARCMRDEDTRGDRQPEFTQLDLEMSFVEREDVMALNEKLLIEIVKKLYPEKKIQEIPFPKLSHKEAMEKYGTDRPDLRENKTNSDLLAFCWITDFPFFERVKDTRNPSAEGAIGSSLKPSTDGSATWTFTHNPFSMPKEEHIESLLKEENIGEILTTQYDVVLNGIEIGGGSIRAHRADLLKKVFETIGHKERDIERDFGHMLQALASGAPPHGGIAWGLDRLIMLLQNEPNIREVIAFPKTGEGRDLMMDSPSDIPEKHLRELGIQIIKQDKKI